MYQFIDFLVVCESIAAPTLIWDIAFGFNLSKSSGENNKSLLFPFVFYWL